MRIILSHNIGDGTGVSASDLVSVTNIDTWFRNNTTIKSLNDLLKFTNVTSISNIATNDTNLISATLGEGLLEIKNNCFYNCSSLLTINFPSTLTKINDNRQYNDWGAFQGCTSLTTITGGENITVLGPAFTNCSNLLNLSDINGLVTTDICYYSSVLTIILPANNIPTIDYRFAGNDCPNLTKIIILSSTPPSLETTSLDTVWKTTCKIYVPNPLVYQSTPGWSTILDRIFSLSHSDLNDITWYTKSNS